MTKSLLSLTLISAFHSAHGAELRGITMPNDRDVAGQKLVLNGLGARLATIFKVQVYVAGLYLTEKSNNPEQILSTNTPKIISMHFLRDVSTKQLTEALGEGFEKACGPNCPQQDKDAIANLQKAMTDMKKGETMEYIFTGESMQVMIRGESKGNFAGPAFAKTLLSVWLGPNPPNRELKSGLLGL